VQVPQAQCAHVKGEWQMVLLEQMQSEPEPETLVVGELAIVFNRKFGDERAESWADQYIGLLNDALSERRIEFSFYYNEKAVVVSNLFLDLYDIIEGSIVAKAKVVGTFVLATYGAVASYPSFKEAIPVIANDLRSVVEHVVKHAPERPDDAPRPARIELYIKDESEVESQLDEKYY
jgi:hypothetical protein